MLHHIELDGKKWPLLFGNYAFRRLKERGITLQDVITALSDSDPTVLPDVVYCGIIAGLVKTGNTEAKPTDAELVALWMDEKPGVVSDVLPMLVQAIQDMSGVSPEPDSDHDAKKKK